MRHLRSKVVLVVAAVVTAAMPLAAQAPAQKPSFEVASVKPNKLGRTAGPPRVGIDAGRFVASNADLRMLLQFAYHPPSGRTLRFTDIIGLPGWAESDRFDVEAVDGRPLGTRLDVLMRDMVQSLLEDRFQLKAHWDEREMATFNLVVAKNGTKLKLSADQGPAAIDDLIRDPRVTAGRGVVRTLANPSPSGMMLTLSGIAVPIDTLVNGLQSYAGRPVFNKTGLAGMFDLRLVFFLETAGGNAVPQPTAASDPVGPSLATAIEEQLGLRLESAKGLVEVLVIDSVQKPSEN